MYGAMPLIDTSKDLNSLFIRQARATPHALALEDDSSSYTYIELDCEVDALARQLRGYGVGRDVLVGVLLPRSAHYVIACMATLRAGGAFLVLELAYPPDLLADVVQDASPVVVLSHASEAGKIKDSDSVPLILMDEPTRPTSGPAHSSSYLPLPDDSDLDRLAFVSYSSGTTGKPKGIANSHRAAVLSYELRFHVQDVRPGDRVACNVFFIWEMIRPLLRGATVVAVPDEVSYDPTALVDLLASKRINETLMTPTLLTSVLARHAPLGSLLPNLSTLWLNGEVVSTELAHRAIRSLPNTRLLNCYSACETHEIACGDIREMINNESPCCPVGPPLDPKHAYILDESGRKVVDGVSGELAMGGPLLARGYLNLPETTAKAFSPNPFDAAPGSRLYRTGDLARLLPSGLLEITGRVGAMIKLRGYSVVPGKVENSIVKHLAVSRCAVVAHGEGLERQLVAYVVPEKNENADRPFVEIDESAHSAVARRALAPFLAHYMLPTLWVELDDLPTHEVTGKVNLKHLPLPIIGGTEGCTGGGSSSSNTGGSKRDPIGIDDISGLWSVILKTPRTQLKAEDNFFDLGGHSLSLADLSARLSQNFGFRIPISRLAEDPTLAGHLEAVRAVGDGHTAAVQADLPGVLRSDSILDDDIRPPGKATTLTPANHASAILLTGVTGFLGAFLLRDLLVSTSAQIICLVRFNEPANDDDQSGGGVARIRRNLLDLGLWRDSMMERVEILPGNLSRTRFGLSPDAFDGLAERVQVIVHAAATVNLVYPYAALRGPNVGGTREILRLACKGGATVQYISTNGVLPASPPETGWSEDSMLDVSEVPDKLLDGYGQTKWVAEQLVLEAGRRGLPVKIHRAGTISGDSETGAANAWDLLSALLVESIKLGYAPDVQGWRVEMTPVDFVSKAIIHLATQARTDHRVVFHLGDPAPVPAQEVFRLLEDLGYPTQSAGWDEWVSLWTQTRGSVRGDGAFTVDILRGGMPTVDFLRGIVVLDNTATRPYCEIVEQPRVDRSLLETYTRHWFARGWLLRAPKREHAAVNGATRKTESGAKRGPLSGRVAVVTGASSGIGAATAAALVHQGCSVALGARRLSALDVLRRKLSAEHRDCRIVTRQTDVVDRKQVEALVEAANRELGPVDIVVPCAGVMYFTMMANARTDEWERTVDVNCKGFLNALSTTVPGMLARLQDSKTSDGQGTKNSAHVVGISSDAARKVFPGLGVYSASKFFVEMTLQSLRLETAGTGMKVTSIQPGNTATDLLNMSTDKEAIEKYGQPSGGQILDPDDVARSIVYALTQPPHVSVNEVLIEPRDEPI